MSTATLQRDMGEANSYFSDDSGKDNLAKVLAALSSAGETLSFKQVGATTTGIKASMVTDVPTRIATLQVHVGDTGDAGDTVVSIRVDGTLLTPTVTVDNAEDDDTAKGVAVDTKVDAGSLVEIDITAAPTAGALVTATLRLKPVTVEL